MVSTSWLRRGSYCLGVECWAWQWSIFHAVSPVPFISFFRGMDYYDGLLSIMGPSHTDAGESQYTNLQTEDLVVMHQLSVHILDPFSCNFCHTSCQSCDEWKSLFICRDLGILVSQSHIKKAQYKLNLLLVQPFKISYQSWIILADRL